MGKLVWLIVLVGALLASINFGVSYLGVFRERGKKRRMRKAEKEKIQVFLFGGVAVIWLDFVLSYAAATVSKLLSCVFAVLNILLIVVLAICVLDAYEREAAVFESIATPSIICLGIAISGIFPTNFAMALIVLGGILVGVSVFKVFAASFNRTARASPNTLPALPRERG